MLPPGGWWLEAGKLIPIAPAVCGPFLRDTRPGTAHLSVSRRAAGGGHQRFARPGLGEPRIDGGRSALHRAVSLRYNY